MCERDTWELVRVWIPADLSCTGSAHWEDEKIDTCIAPLVRALQEGGINMRWSCCGHGRDFGHICLQDGRMLIITNADLYYRKLHWVRTVLKYALQRQVRYVINRWLVYRDGIR